MAQTNSPCKDCVEGATEIQLHAEIEHLKQHLSERDAHIEAMETEFLKGNTRVTELEEQIVTWREKYDRLYDSHKRVQRVNQNLEEKLLHMADKCTVDKAQLARDVETLSVRLAEYNYTIGHLHKENERYKNDMNLAIQLLQCKPDNFVSQKFDSLPSETQARVSSYIMSKAKLSQEGNQSGNCSNKSSPLALEKINPDEFEFNISASLMSKILEESVQNTISKHCDTCTCQKLTGNPFSYGDTHYSVATQTILGRNAINALCLNCNSDVNSLKSSLSARCNSPLPAKVLTGIEEHNRLPITDKDIPSPVFLVRQPPTFNKKPTEHNKTLQDNDVQTVSAKAFVKPNSETSKLVGLKHKEIMSKIGENLKEINLKEEFAIAPLEPVTGHHRLCDRTKPTGSSTDNLHTKFDDEKKSQDETLTKPITKAFEPPTGVKTDPDITYCPIENSIPIPNIVADLKENHIPTSKSDLNAVEPPKVYHKNCSISSNDAESKTSSNRSSKKNSSQSGSNNKVHIGPGPRFCSLRMQAGSKNILLDNAQPNIAPVLYTRQTRNLDSSPISAAPLGDSDTTSIVEKMEIIQIEPTSPIVTKTGKNPSIASVSTNIPLDQISNILDMPNDEFISTEPICLCDKPESGYKSNESEKIEKLLLGIDSVIPERVVVADTSELQKQILTPQKEVANTNGPVLVDIENEKLIDKIQNGKVEEMKSDETLLGSKVPAPNVNVFNFDQYERSLKHSKLKIQPERKIDVAHLNNLENTKIPSDSRLLLSDNPTEVLNANYDLKMASKNLSEINKKFTRTAANQTLPENMLLDSKNVKEWKKETSTEKSSSSLSSDDSAAVLQKQQLLRVAEWVKKNLEMEQQIDLDVSDSCPQSAEELHHVRNDFPRPAKVEHRSMKKNNSKSSHKPHHSAKTNANSKGDSQPVVPVVSNQTDYIVNGEHSEENRDNRLTNDVGTQNVILPSEDEKSNDKIEDLSNHHMLQQNIAADFKNSNSDYAETNGSSSYSREELARMEYNVRRFLLNGKRWTREPAENYHSNSRRTSSKTETDL